MNFRDLAPIDRPREKIARLNPEALSDKELLALVLRTGWAGQDVMELAAAVLKTFPDGLNGADYQQLKNIKGIGKSRAAAILAAMELAKRWTARKDLRPVLDTASRVLAQVPLAICSSRKEHFIAFYLNARTQMLYSETVSIGTLSASLVHPREVFAPAISHSAAALIVLHNHPSGDATPSTEDKDATRRLSQSGQLLGIPLLDHIIVTASGSFFSFRENGLLLGSEVS